MMRGRLLRSPKEGQESLISSMKTRADMSVAAYSCANCLATTSDFFPDPFSSKEGLVAWIAICKTCYKALLDRSWIDSNARITKAGHTGLELRG